METKNTKLLILLSGALAAIILAGCFKILSITQPAAATGGEQIIANLQVSVEGISDANPHYGIVGLLVPNDWVVDSVYFSGGYTDYCTYLDPDSGDAEPGPVDYWTDSLEARYPSGADMQWVVYQSSTSHTVLEDTVDVFLSVMMTTGLTQGNFDLGYFVTDAALDFTDPDYYDLSLNNPITISGVVPVELTSFNASVTKGGISLKWETATETNNRGFEIERSTDSKIFSRIGYVEGNGTSANKNSYQFTDKNLIGGVYYYRLKQIDIDGSYNYSKIVQVDYTLPVEFSLSQNYPNPFNPSTSIQVSIPIESQVTVTLYNSIGEEISVITNGSFAAGKHTLNFDASKLSSGTYIYTVLAKGSDGSNFVQSRKMVLMK
ncbi:MAG: T9SS type A sorting domain-containing protein [Ignavibacteriaceae bacterium]